MIGNNGITTEMQAAPAVNVSVVHRFLVGIALLVAAVVALRAHPVAAHSVAGNANVDTITVEGLILDESLCGVGGYRIDGTELCTHGPDAMPSEESRAAAVAAATAGQLEGPTVLCDGDGVSGKRVQVLYVRPADAPDQYNESVQMIRLAAGDADAIFDASARETGGHRHIRFVTDSACQIVVTPVVIAAGSADAFASSINVLRSMGYTDPTRKYLMFMDWHGYCGIASTVADNRPGADNRSNLIAGYARVDFGCWDGVSVAHELTHTLGGVQQDAPHSSKSWHCTDEYDIMCYSDSPNFPAMNYICSDSRFGLLLDCNHDDYFHTNPPAGNYLASHWNVANSEFLSANTDASAALPALQIALVEGQSTVAAGTDVVLEVELPATFSNGERGYTIQKVEFVADDGLVSTVAEGPYRLSWKAEAVGVHTFIAHVYDQNEIPITLSPLTLTVTEAAPPAPTQQALFLPLVMN